MTFLVRTSDTQRDIKALLGDDIQFDKWKSELNPKAVNILTLPQLEKLMLLLVMKGNKVAIEMSLALVGMSLKQLCCDAFGVKFDLDERQAYLKARFEGKIERNKFTDEIKVYQVAKGTYGNDPFEFATATDIINQHVLGMKAATAKTHYRVPKGELLRDHLPSDKLCKLKSHEEVAAAFVRRGYKPLEAAKEAIEFLKF